jgi:transcriptional regulator with XRE-family HTH domain
VIREELIGRRIRQLRIERNMTQEVLAQRAELTKGYLSKIENSPNSPPVSTLIKISSALGVGIDTVFSEEGESTDFTLVRESEREVVATRGSSFGYSYEPLALHFPNRHMDPYVMTAPADVEKMKAFAHKGEEMIFVLEGQVLFHVGEHEVLLEAGDCIYFNSSVPHWGESGNGSDVKYLAVFYTPGEDEDDTG